MTLCQYLFSSDIYPAIEKTICAHPICLLIKSGANLSLMSLYEGQPDRPETCEPGRQTGQKYEDNIALFYQTDSTLAWLCFPSLANCLIIVKNVDNDIFKTSSPPPLHFVLSNIWLEMLDLFVVISADDPDH